MHILGIETTCDETAVSVVVDGKEILSNVIASQSLHTKYGGVYPEMASREHTAAITSTIDLSLVQANVDPKQIDLIAVAKGPGLVGPLMVGLSAAKTLSIAWNIPFLGVNHVEAHLYAAIMQDENPSFPAIGLVVSGGHTFLVKILDIGCYEFIGSTQDDAVGEAFDKVASLLDLPYPGGPHIESLAQEGDPRAYPFSPGKVKGRCWDFSFSGLKTNVLYAIKGQNRTKKDPTVLNKQEKADVAASFQEVALTDIATKAKKAAEHFGAKAIYVGGGVSQNRRLRQLMDGPIPSFWPAQELCADNGAMIAGLAYHLFDGIGSPLDLEPKARISLEDTYKVIPKTTGAIFSPK